MGWRAAAFAVFSMICMSAVPLQARADAALTANASVWKAMTRCSQSAHKSFPDYNPVSNQKRDTLYQECLRQSHLPPGTAASSPPPAATR